MQGKEMDKAMYIVTDTDLVPSSINVVRCVFSTGEDVV